MATDYQVKRQSDGHVVFRSSLEKDAKKFVENNFPRVHSNPGTDYGDDGAPPDVVLVTPAGDESVYYGPEHEDGWVDK